MAKEVTINTNVIRILHIVPNMDAGGLETFIMNLYRNIDRNKVQFDFLVHYKRKCYYDDEIKALGGIIYRIPLRDNNNIFKYIRDLNKFYKEHSEYKIIHCHMASIGFINFLVARHNGIKVRIAHSHSISCENSLKGFIKRLLIKPCKYLSTTNFACSKEAGEHLFKNRVFEVIPNGIDLDKFKFNKRKRMKVRKEWNVSNDTIVIGHIGRFNLSKNHPKVIEIFKEYHQKNSNSILVLVGIGSEQEKIRKIVKKNNLEKSVKFLGVRSDTDYLYSGFDIFLFPSLYEGLGIVLIEAQTSGLYCYTTLDKVPKSACISNRLEYIDLSLSSKNWASKINDKDCFNREGIVFNDNKNNFDIKAVADKLMLFYQKYYNIK